ncbi:hypothetical protein GYMLUDRAFT_35294 [Collybiopsis luxurians FD-317 M1]|nr:hypothetical protein GYMLUDRAFT_35294 [Collybiopsis luxurians FD-317 M1]
MRPTISFLLCVLTLTNCVYGYRPFRGHHDNSEDLAQDHNAPRSVLTEHHNRDRFTQYIPPSLLSNQPQIPPSGPDYQPVELCRNGDAVSPKKWYPTRSSSIHERISLRSETSVPADLAVRQIHNADYSSSSMPPSNSFNNNSTDQSHPSSHDEAGGAESKSGSDDKHPSSSDHENHSSTDKQERATVLRRPESMMSHDDDCCSQAKLRSIQRIRRMPSPADRENSLGTSPSNNAAKPSTNDSDSNTALGPADKPMSDDEHKGPDPDAAPEQVERRTTFRFRR